MTSRCRRGTTYCTLSPERRSVAEGHLPALESEANEDVTVCSDRRGVGGAMARAALAGALLAFAAGAAATEPAGDPVTEAAGVWTFARCLERVQAQDLGGREAQLRVERSRLGLEDARRAFYPSTTVTSGVFLGNLEDDRHHSFYLSLRVAPILSGYEQFFATRLADFQVRLGELEVDQARALLAWRVRESYLTIVSLAEAEDRLAEAVSAHERLVEIASAEGDPDLAMVRRLDAQTALLRQRLDLRELRGRRSDEELRLKTLLDLAPETPFAVDRDTRPATVLAAEDGAEGQADLASRRESLNQQLARKRLQVSRFDRLPQPVLRMGLNQGGLDIRSGAYLFMGVEVPLFDWGRRKRRSAQLELEVSETEQQGKRLSLQRRAELARLEAQRQALEDRERGGVEMIELARRKLVVQEQLYRVGRIATAELAAAQAELARLRAEQALAQGRLWAVLCRRGALLATGVTGAS